jgi:low temperature requirement protein LtrA
VAIGTAANELAHYVAEEHVVAGVAAFAFSTFAVIWAWIGYTWFASAYDTDDWMFRLATMVQMVGVIVVALGIPQVFASMDHGETLDIGVIVAGYVVMRIPILFLWWEVSRQDPQRAPTARTYIVTGVTAQLGWVLLAIIGLSLGPTLALYIALVALELAAPYVSERRGGRTPWHPHHIAERYSLLVIITLGEVILGTVAALNALVHGAHGWTVDAALLAVAGVGLTVGCWWMYFAVPWAEPLARHRERGYIFGYGHILIFGPLAAMGAGLHVSALMLEGGEEVKIGATGAVFSVALPLAIFALAFYGIYSGLLHEHDPFHLLLLAGTGAFLVAGVVLAAAGVTMSVCLIVLALAPVVTVVGYESLGHRHMADALGRL